MNLREWLNYQKNCPLCQAPLTTYLHSSRRQSVRWDEERMIVVYPLHDKKLSSDYNVGYAFSLSSNQFGIEFYNKEGAVRVENSPFHLMDKFKSLDRNLRHYKFYCCCSSCQRYHYSSDVFRLDLKSSTFYPESGLSVFSEYFGLIQVMEKDSKTLYRIYRLLNNYFNSSSQLIYWGSNDPQETLWDKTVPYGAEFLDLPLIDFISPEETLSRIQKLLVFS